MKRHLLVWLILLTFCSDSWASHIAGGNIELVALDKPGQFQLSLNLYIDDASKGRDATIAPSITLSVFRKSDDKLMGDYPLKLGRRLILVYANPACARSRGRQTSEVRYSNVVQFDPAAFSDPAGYYVVSAYRQRFDLQPYVNPGAGEPTTVPGYRLPAACLRE